VKVVVVVSANGEWTAMRTLLAPSQVCETLLGEWFEAKMGGRRLSFFHGGWGRVSASATTQYVIDHFNPDLLVNIGTCGGFQGYVERGTIILVEQTVVYDILEQMTDSDEAIEHYSTKLDLSWLPRIAPSPVTRGLMASGDRDIVPKDIPTLIARYHAIAADWESGAVAWVGSRNGTRVLILRGVSDLVGTEGGEVYGDYELFLDRTKEIMGHLTSVLPMWLDAIEEIR
jgi:adenosylhomocysteine nucleosidase